MSLACWVGIDLPGETVIIPSPQRLLAKVRLLFWSGLADATRLSQLAQYTDNGNGGQ